MPKVKNPIVNMTNTLVTEINKLNTAIKVLLDLNHRKSKNDSKAYNDCHHEWSRKKWSHPRDAIMGSTNGSIDIKPGQHECVAADRLSRYMALGIIILKRIDPDWYG